MTSLARRADDEREFPFDMNDFNYLASLVYDASGIVLGPHKKNMVYSRLSRRVRALRLNNFTDYCDMVRANPKGEELGFLINAITTNLTKFFREIHHFEHLRDSVIPEIANRAQRGGNKRLRIWSAGCSSGEEPYTIGMTLSEALPNLSQWDAKILATDLDTNMVAKAHSGVYGASLLTDLPKGKKEKFFEAMKGGEENFRVIDPVRRLITFKQLNLLGPWPIKGPFDAIFCRNVMIYFDAPTKAKLVQRYAELLKPGGWLYIGHSESLLDSQTSFKLKGRTIYQKQAS